MAETNRNQGRDPLSRHNLSDREMQYLSIQKRAFKDLFPRTIVHTDILNPTVGLLVQNPLDNKLWWYGLDEQWHTVIEAEQYEIKITADQGGTSTADGFTFLIPEDLDNAVLIDAQAYVTTNGVANSLVNLHNLGTGLDMLLPGNHIRIDSGHHSSYTSAAPPSIAAPPNSVVHKNDLVQNIVETVGLGIKGLGTILRFGLVFS